MASTTMTALPAYGTLRIGSYTLTNYTETDVVITPVRSMDGRTISYSDVTINIHAKITGNGSGDASANLEMAFALPNLQKSAVTVVYAGRGLDRLLRGGGARDVAWGPMPGSLRIKPLGSIPANAFEVWFTITAKVPTCPSARYAGAIDLATTISYAQDDAGYLTRTYSGRLRIVNNLRPDGRGGTDSPDLYREDVTPPLLPGFYRKFGPWVTSEDRTELSFSIIDDELPGLNVPPDWVVGQPVLSDNVATMPGSKGGLKRWTRRFSGHYELAKDAPDEQWPALHFFEVFVKGRHDLMRKAFDNRRNGTGSTSAILPVSVEFGEPSVLGRRLHDFSVTFLFADDIETVVKDSGMWSELPGSNWQQWATSLSTSAFNVRGTANAVFDIGDDRTVTGLCSTPATPSAGYITRELRTAGAGWNVNNWVDRVLRGITEQKSWIAYDNKLSIVPQSRTLPIKILPSPTEARQLQSTPGVSGAGTSTAPPLGGKWAELDRIIGEKYDAARLADGFRSIRGGIATGSAYGPGGSAMQFQRVGPDTFKVIMAGYAMRANYPIPAPTLTQVGGAVVVPAYDENTDFWNHSVVANWASPVYGAGWHFTYYVKGPILSPIGVAPNPMMGVASSS